MTRARARLLLRELAAIPGAGPALDDWCWRARTLLMFEAARQAATGGVRAIVDRGLAEAGIKLDVRA